MTNVIIESDKLVIEIQGWDKLWSLKSRLEIPLNHISGVRSGASERVTGIRAPGTRIPGVITAGAFHHHGKKVFWDVHDPAKAIVIDLHDERYSTLIVEVNDPLSAIRNIEAALTPTNV